MKKPETVFRSFSPFLGIGHNAGANSSHGRNHGRDFKNGNKSFPFIVIPLAMAPAVSTLGFRVAGQIEYFNLALPHGLTLKHFMHGNGFAVNRAAPMQLFNRHLDAG